MPSNPASSLLLSPVHPSRAHPSFRVPSSFSKELLTDDSQQANSFFKAAAILQHCSELRTRMADTAVPLSNQGLYANDSQRCSCPPDATVMPLDCEECVHECGSEPCDVGLSSECTDQCVVVACSDSHHTAVPCDVPLLPDQCEPCDVACEPDCTELEEFLQCCADYHGYIPDSRSYPYDMASVHPDLVWDPSVAAFLCGCADTPVANLTGGYAGMSTATSTESTPQLTPSPVALHPQAQQLLQPTPVPSNSHTQASQVPSNIPPFYTTPQSTLSPQPQMLAHKCQWGGCFASFASLAELVGHVNLQHLRLASATPPSTSSLPLPMQSAPQDPSHALGVSDGLSCMWADCHLYPSAQSIPGPSTGNALDSALGVLASHLLEDHLGFPLRLPKQEQTLDQHVQAPAPAAPSVASDNTGLYSPPTPLPEHDCSASPAHVCRWEGCTSTFPSCDELTAHITTDHVGAGKAHYECQWEGCARRGDKGFSSKQKILRHLQSHTGHRPFQCEICGQYFSETATLAQHKRRHTQEKPYVCDFPGCGKSFAITGALTIHKRTHNGHKPFKCTYCERAFAESSNLSKHLRTHTGARPYLCAEPGCNKSFARPDQLARHQNVHRKKSAEAEIAN